MYTGTVLTSLNIRSTPSTANPALGKLNVNDIVTADVVSGGWWTLKSITRAGANVPLPQPVCYAYEGATQGYIRTDSVTTPPPATAATVEVIVNGATVYKYP